MDQVHQQLLGGFGDKENAGGAQAPQDKCAAYFGDGGPIQIRVTASAGPPDHAGEPGLEPLSPSKRFNAAGPAQLPLPGGPGLGGLAGTPCQPPSLDGEAKQQICFDYTKGVCKRGAACKFSHDVEEIVRVNSQERGVCFDFLRGCCQRGLLCRFSHDLSSIVMQDQGQKPGRRNAPICYDFVKGVCARDDCRYSHDIFSVLRGHQARAAPPQACYDFSRGRCTRGSACRYAHELSPEAMAAFPGDAVAALAAQHAQLAAAAALEASRRQSAPGCIQQPGAAPDPFAAAALLGGLAHPQAHLAPGLHDSAQAALALQLHSQWLLHVQAASLMQQQQQQQVPQGLPGWEQPLAQAPWAAAPKDPRRHTHDGAQRPLADAALLQQLQALRLRQAPPEQAKIPPFDPSKGRMGPLPSQPNAATIGAGWHAASQGRLDLSRCAPLDLAQRGQPPPLGPPREPHLPTSGSLTDRQLRPLDPMQGAVGPGQPPRVPLGLRPPQPSHAGGGGGAQADPLWHPIAGAALRHPVGGPGPIRRASTDVAAQVAAAALAPGQLEQQRVGSDQLALFQEIWRQ